MKSSTVRVWDPLVRVFHWSLVLLFTANAILTDPEGRLHERVGYAILILLAVRLAWGLIGTRHARFADFPPSVPAAVAQAREMATWRRHGHLGHSPLGALMIYNLFVTLAAIGLTGYMMGTNMFFGIEWVEEAHEALVSWAELSVVVHVAAVIVESRRLGYNLARSMVTGLKPAEGMKEEA